jgi:hypothetical protein
MRRGPTFDLAHLRRMRRGWRLARKFPLTKDEARAWCAAAAEVVAPEVVPPLPKGKRFKQYWRAYHDYTKK